MIKEKTNLGWRESRSIIFSTTKSRLYAALRCIEKELLSHRSDETKCKNILTIIREAKRELK